MSTFGSLVARPPSRGMLSMAENLRLTRVVPHRRLRAYPATRCGRARVRDSIGG